MKKFLLCVVISIMLLDVSIANLTEREKFDSLSKEISNWGRWGEKDQLGTLNNISDSSIIEARKLIIEGKTISQIQEILHLTEPAVKARIRRARAYLKKILLHKYGSDLFQELKA